MRRGRAAIVVLVAALSGCTTAATTRQEASLQARLRTSAPPWIVKVALDATTRQGTDLVEALRTGRLSGLYAEMPDGLRYPLPGYVIATNMDLRRGIEIRSTQTHQAFRTTLAGAIGKLILLRAGKKIAGVPSGGEVNAYFAFARVPIEPFITGLESQEPTTTREAVALRSRLLGPAEEATPHSGTHARAAQPAEAAAAGAAVGEMGGMLISPMTSIAGLADRARGGMEGMEPLPDDAAVRRNFSSSITMRFSRAGESLTPDRQMHPELVGFGFGPYDSDRWIFSSDPLGAYVRGLDVPNTIRTSVRIENLPPAQARNVVIVARGYHPCRFMQARRHIVSYGGLEWILVFCGLQKAP